MLKSMPQYESCIKINGASILPPLITPEKQTELEKYRQEAIKRESQRSSRRTQEAQESDSEQSQNRLQRRNSYVLDAPSEALLEYLNSLKYDEEESSININTLETTSVFSNHAEIVDFNATTSIPESSLSLPLLTSPNSSDSPTFLENETVLVVSEPILHSYTNEEMKHRAASTITAGVRGYLTRRLAKTEKAQHLLQTIKESLICAIGLHKDAREVIREADVELHRRLIQQVSNACSAYYDLFLETPVFEQLSCIAYDRKRKRDKLKRRTQNGIRMR